MTRSSGRGRGGRRAGAGRPPKGRPFVVGERLGTLVVEGVLRLGGLYVLRCDCGALTKRIRSHLLKVREPTCSVCGGRPLTVHLRWGSVARCGRQVGVLSSSSVDAVNCADCLLGRCDPELLAQSILVLIRTSAKKRRISVTINAADVLRVRVGKDCGYCGAELGGAPGLDRIDNRRGYAPDNIQACCFNCNMAKGSVWTDEEFRAAMAVRLARTGWGKAWEEWR